MRDRLETLDEHARAMAACIAVVGTPASLDLLQRIAGVSSAGLADALEELAVRGMVGRVGQGPTSTYGFTHPVVRRVVYHDLDPARARALHEAVVAALESMYGDQAEAHATELAPHLRHAAGLVPRERALGYYIAAGKDALARQAHADAARWLARALDLAEGAGGGVGGVDGRLVAILVSLARARRGLGANTAARELLQRAREEARASGDALAVAGVEWRLGLVALESGEPRGAAAHFASAEASAGPLHDLALLVRARIGRAMALQALGESAAGRGLVTELVPRVEASGDAALAARVHRTMAVLYSWTGPAAKARQNGESALRHAGEGGDLEVAWSVHWALALVAGLSGDGAAVRRHQQEADLLAEELHSPVLRARSAEIAIEYASATGDWDEALDLARRALPVARALAPRTLLPRLLVWTALILIERGAFSAAHARLQEAHRLSRAGSGSADLHNANAAVPVCVGMATFHLRQERYDRAAAFAERGLAIADRLGLVAWSIQRLLPVLCEARLWLGEYDRAQALADRLHREASEFGHPLGLAWAEAVYALLRRFRDAERDAHVHLLAAAERIEAIPVLFPAARLRRNAAQLLAGEGHDGEAERQLKLAYVEFERMGATHELRRAQLELKALGRRAPVQALSRGGALTGRQEDVVRLVCRGLSSKAVARELGVATKTVENHLARIYEKLEVGSRGELFLAVRELGL